MPLPCSLQLDVYFPPSLDPLIDETVIDWSVSTDPAHAAPYLLAPRQYATQEIDPITCSASIGQVEVGVVDAPTDPDDQDSGWMTAKVFDLLGRRCRLSRYVNSSIGWVVVADGPAGPPKMDQSYAAYRWTIRDTRDTERKIHAFSEGCTTAIVPPGPIYDWGHYTDGSGAHVLLPSVLTTPLTGKFRLSAFGVGYALGYIALDQHFSFGNPSLLNEPRLVISDAREQALKVSELSANVNVARFADVLWRIAGDTDWNRARPSIPTSWLANWPFVTYADAVLDPADTDTIRALANVVLFLNPGGVAPAGFPADNDDVEFIIRYRGPANAELPYYVEGELGDVLQNLYTGVYENPINTGIIGDVYDPAGLETLPTVPTTIRFDPTAFSPMTEQVLLRQTSVVDDGRSFAESQLYQPSGYIPALDNDGNISPMSRTRPAFIDTSLEVTNAHVVPSPAWNTGGRTVSSIEYTYSRYFIPDPTAGFATEPDGIAVRPITITYEDPDSLKRYGENPETFDASAFSGIGTIDGSPLPGQTEQANTFAQLARFDVLDRFRSGVQVIAITARRSKIPNVRAGDWIPWNLSWFPDRTSGARSSLIDAAQIVSIRDDDCTWRTLVLEESGAPGALVDQPGYYDNLQIDLDDLDPGYYNNLLELADDADTGVPLFATPFDKYQKIFAGTPSELPNVTVVGTDLEVFSGSNGLSTPRGAWWGIPDEDQVWETQVAPAAVEDQYNEHIHIMIGSLVGSTENGLCFGPGVSYSGPGGTLDRKMHLYRFGTSAGLVHRGVTIPDYTMWLRIERIGDVLNFYFSEDGSSWTLEKTLSITTDFFGVVPNRIGLGVINHVVNDGTPTKGIYEYLTRIS